MTEKNNVIKAINKNVRSGARKANLVLNFIKGKKADVAIKDLEFTRKKVAMDIKKTVKSAIANAENNKQLDAKNKIVATNNNLNHREICIEVKEIIRRFDIYPL